MKKTIRHIFLLAACLCMPVWVSAEVVKLKSGGKITGTIVFQNDDVVVLKDATGARFQYLMTDVESILAEEQPEVQQEEQVVTPDKRVTFGLDVAVGAAMIPEQKSGTDILANLSVGTAHLLDKKIMLGGSIGLHTVALNASVTNPSTLLFLPVQLKIAAPFTDKKNAPMIGVSAGYGAALNSQYKGGFCADIQFGWRHELKKEKALFLGMYAHFQQAQLMLYEMKEVAGAEENTVVMKEFMGHSNCSIAGVGLRLGFFL